jgi:hypothetical protein
MTFSVCRSAVAWLVLAVTGVVLVAASCGRASASENADARLFGSEVNLRASDLHGFKVETGLGSEGNPGPLNRRIETCDGGPVAPAGGRGAISPLFQSRRPVQTVLSAVYRLRSASIASRYVEAADSHRGLRCIQSDDHPEGVAAPRTAVFDVRAHLGSSVLVGVRSVRCLISASECDGSSVRGFTDRLLFKAGPYIVMLFFVAGPSTETTPRHALLPIERHLLGRLYSRARKHEH